MQEEIILQEVERDILEVAVNSKELRFRDFENPLVRRKEDDRWIGKYAKQTVIKYLNGLIDEGLIEVRLSSKEQGFRRVYCITEKGQLAILIDNTETIRRNLDPLEKLTATLLSSPEKLDEWRATTRSVIRGIASNVKLPLEEKARLITEERNRQFEAFRKVLRNMHQISLQLFAPSPMNKKSSGDFYFHVNENGVIDVFSEFETIKHSDVNVTSM